MAVPVSWHPGKTRPDAMFAFFSSSMATNLSLAEASGSSSIFRSCCKWAGRSRWAISPKAVRERVRRASPETERNSSPLTVVVDTASAGKICLYSTWSNMLDWNRGVYSKFGGASLGLVVVKNLCAATLCSATDDAAAIRRDDCKIVRESNMMISRLFFSHSIFLLCF